MMSRAPYGAEILNFQLVDRLNYLRNFLENAPIKDLTTFYPQLGKFQSIVNTSASVSLAKHFSFSCSKSHFRHQRQQQSIWLGTATRHRSESERISNASRFLSSTRHLLPAYLSTAQRYDQVRA